MVYDEIKSNAPSNLSKLEIARYLYIKCGEAFCFDTKINNTECITFYKLLNKRIDSKSFDEILVNCYTWSQFYSALLSDFEIENHIFKGWHSFVNFRINGVLWVADATYGKYSDLSRIHYCDETSMFGPCFYESGGNRIVDDDTYKLLLSETDKKINYPQNQQTIKFKELLYSLKKDSINKHLSCDGDIVVSKLIFIFSNIGCLSFGYYEAKEFVFELERIILNDSEFNKVISIELVRKNSMNGTDLLQCICVNTSNGFVYFILCPNLPIYQINSEDFASLFYLGFRPKKSIPGIDESNIYISSNFQELSRYDFIQAKTKKLDYVKA